MNKEVKAQKVKEEYEMMCNEMSKDNYEEKAYVFSKLKTYVAGIAIPLIITIILGKLYRFLHGNTLDFELNYAIFTILIIASIIIHELIHGLAWCLGCKQGFKSIAFGLNGLMPYCHCKEALDCTKYLVGVLMPFLILGTGLLAIAFASANMWILITAVINIFVAGGDLLIAFELRKAKKARIFDHPTDPGFIAFEKNVKSIH